MMTPRTRLWGDFSLFAAIGALGALACSDAPTEPSVVVAGVSYTGSTAPVLTMNKQHQVTVLATLRNVSGSAITLTYATDCPVRIQLLRLTDGAIVYDETRLPCDLTKTSTIQLDVPSQNLSSAFRLANAVAGDSLAHINYRVRAAVMTNGTQPIMIEAGYYTLVTDSTSTTGS